MMLRRPLYIVPCVVALSGFAMTPAAAQFSFDRSGAVFVPGSDGVLWLDAPPPPILRGRDRTGIATVPRVHAFAGDEISQRYLNSLPRKPPRRARPAEMRRTAEASPPAPAAPAVTAPATSTPAVPQVPAPASDVPKTDASKTNGDQDRLREQVTRLGAETAGLRSEIAALKEELAKRAAAAPIVSEPPKQEAPRSDELPKIRDEAARLKDETARLRGEGEGLRDQLTKLNAETSALKTGMTALKDELAKRPVAPVKAEEPRNDDLPKVKEEAARLKDETSRLRGESNKLRDQLTKLVTETGGLKGELAALREELAKRPTAVAPVVSSKVDDAVRKEEPLKRGDSLKKSGKDNKVVERAPGSEESDAGVMGKAWRRLLDMMGKPKDAP